MLIKRLDQLSVIINMRRESKEYAELLQVLNEIDNRLINYTPASGAESAAGSRVEDAEMRDEFEVETINVDSVKSFRQYGGIVIFKRILLLSVLVVNTSSNSNESPTSQTSFSTFPAVQTTRANSSIHTKNDSDEDEDDDKARNPWRGAAMKNQSHLNKPSSVNQMLGNHLSNAVDACENSLINNFEKSYMLRIKCKCVQILNRLVCLVKISSYF
jgi:hypothetical protein